MPNLSKKNNFHFLQVAKASINHPTAQANCTARNANLASIHSEEENAFVKGQKVGEK
jgi:hypothetical protein